MLLRGSMNPISLGRLTISNTRRGGFMSNLLTLLLVSSWRRMVTPWNVSGAVSSRIISQGCHRTLGSDAPMVSRLELCAFAAFIRPSRILRPARLTKIASDRFWPQDSNLASMPWALT